MGDLDRLFQEWHGLGGAILLAERESTVRARCPEHTPLASRLAQERALPVFRRWNYLCDELRYL